MNDRELLDLAARAAFGKGKFEWNSCSGFKGEIQYIPADSKHYLSWNPLINDADALRLAVDLGIELYFEGKEQSESVWANEVMLWTEGNRHFATRKAITMAAAEIGRNME